MNAWFYLVLAGCLEIGFTTFMKLSEGFSKTAPSLGFLVCAVLSFVFLSKASAEIPLGTAYAVWTGIGAFGTALIGIVVFKDPSTPLRLLFLFALIASIVGLKFVSND